MGLKEKLENFRATVANNGYVVMMMAAGLVVVSAGSFLITEYGIRIAALNNFNAISDDVKKANDYYTFENNAFQVTTKNEQSYVNFIGPAQKTTEDEKTITAFTVPVSNQLADEINGIITNYYTFNANTVGATYQLKANTLASNWINLAKDVRTVASQPAQTITPLMTLYDVEQLIGQQNNNEQLAAFIPVQEDEAIINTYQTYDNHMKINSYAALKDANVPTLKLLDSQELILPYVGVETLNK